MMMICAMDGYDYFMDILIFFFFTLQPDLSRAIHAGDMRLSMIVWCISLGPAIRVKRWTQSSSV